MTKRACKRIVREGALDADQFDAHPFNGGGFDGSKVRPL